MKLILTLLLSTTILLAKTQNLKTEDVVLKLTNNLRKSRGLSMLKMHPEISKVALHHSQNMANGKVEFGHGGFDKRYDTICIILKYQPVAGENVEYGASTGKGIYEVWRDSPPHLENMLGDYKWVGIGIAKSPEGVTYATEIFAR